MNTNNKYYNFLSSLDLYGIYTNLNSGKRYTKSPWAGSFLGFDLTVLTLIMFLYYLIYLSTRMFEGSDDKMT